MTVLYLMCGVPGCGKSTWINKNKIDKVENLKLNGKNSSNVL